MEVAGSNPVAPIFFQKRPFGEYVEGFSYGRTKTYAIKYVVESDDTESLPLGAVIVSKPPVTERLREFEYFDGDLAFLGAAAAGEVVLELEGFGLVAEFGLPVSERVGVDLVE
ncbi:MAG: hypothetical protein AAF800_04580 [Planctomycetota bacterium]